MNVREHTQLRRNVKRILEDHRRWTVLCNSREKIILSTFHLDLNFLRELGRFCYLIYPSKLNAGEHLDAFFGTRALWRQGGQRALDLGPR